MLLAVVDRAEPSLPNLPNMFGIGSVRLGSVFSWNTEPSQGCVIKAKIVPLRNINKYCIMKNKQKWVKTWKVARKNQKSVARDFQFQEITLFIGKISIV